MTARLIVEEGASDPQTFALFPEQTITVGRNRANTIMVRDARASRLHAEIFFADGSWHVRNCSTTNATRLDGERIDQVTRLKKGQVIGIGAARIRFEAAEGDSIPISAPLIPTSDPVIVSACEQLEPEKLTALFHFMNAAICETTPHGLVTHALRTVRDQTGAAVCGFLSFDLDNDDSQLKVVLPDEAEVNANLSLQLTMKVKSEGASAWLKAPAVEEDMVKSVTLKAYHDALCVPLHRRLVTDSNPDEQTNAASGPLGALHAYHATRQFTGDEVRFCEVLASGLANALHVLRKRRALQADISRLRGHAGRGSDKLIGNSQALRRLREEIAQLALSSCTVLIQGESGVGKELVALALHRESPRHEGPMIAFNCAALTPNMAEAELFGHEKGAFTGAEKARIGLFQQADEGTLFLDEIGELSQDNQARLLRVLETKGVRPILSKSEIKVNVRIIAATNRDLEKEVKAGRFRRDLYFRLGAHLFVPPLREHPEDIDSVAEYFLKCLNDEYKRRIRLTPEALDKLRVYSWPGNVRQLRSVLETAVAMSPSDELRPSCLRLADASDDDDSISVCLNLKELEARAIREALVRTNGVLIQAAELLGIHRGTLVEKMKKYDIRSRVEVTD
jgi:Nif-specific regulatory protein